MAGVVTAIAAAGGAGRVCGGPIVDFAALAPATATVAMDRIELWGNLKLGPCDPATRVRRQLEFDEVMALAPTLPPADELQIRSAPQVPAALLYLYGTDTRVHLEVAEMSPTGCGLEPATDATPPHQTKGELTKPEIGSVIRFHLARFKRCFEDYLATEPNHEGGKVAVEFTIGAHGHVTEASISSSSIEAIDACILETTRRLVFPPPRRGGIVRVTYPFVFGVE